MAIRNSRFAVGLALASAFALAAPPAMAQGWGGGWGGRHRDHDDTGWIVGGIIGLGVIAAIAASASNKNKRDRDARYRDRDYRDNEYRDSRDYRDGRDYRDDSSRYDDRYGQRGDQGYRSYSSRGIDSAVDNCVSEVERGSTRVDSVDTVGRDGDGWRIDGRINGGRPFSCSVSGNGRIRSMTIDGRGAMNDQDEAVPASAG